MITILATALVVPESVDSLPLVVTAYLSGLLAPISLWGLMFLIRAVKRGITVSGGGVVSHD